MYVKNKVVGDVEIYIECLPDCCSDVMCRTPYDNRSILNCGRYYELSLFEHNGKLYVIRRDSNTTSVAPINIYPDRAAIGFILHNTVHKRMSNKAIEKAFARNLFR